MLAAAGLEVKAVQTLGRGHATTLTQKMDPCKVDAVVCVGGDGTVYEALQVRNDSGL